MGELFPDDGLRVAPSAEDDRELTAGERLRRRQAAQIANGYHPLALSVRNLRLHPDAPRILAREDAAAAGDYPACGTCRFRVLFGGHARDFPKCVFGRTETTITDEQRARYPILYGSATVLIDYPRKTGGEQTDVRAWWPGCVDHQPREDTA